MTISVGDKVTVTLPGGEYIGKVQQVIPNYLWSDDTAYRVTGSDPKPFITTTKTVKKVAL